ncbi:sensor histidine kinase [Nocardioides seonyuensis]|uniref:histidine kinase n=1 Tax=Nocardioides seonyuensis TaxID=2518371 RepID=A0A4P7IDT4_9ACTN|nr:sensor histidine kinase [Nocardioides seonyuensis]
MSSLWWTPSGTHSPYVDGVSRAGPFAARLGLDLLVVVTAVVTATTTVLRDDLLHPTGPRFVLGVIGITGAVLVLLARHRFPFAAPACTWVMCSALSFLDGQLIVNGGAILIAGMGAAVLLGSHRNAALSRLGLVIVLTGSVAVVRNGPDSSADDLLSVPLMFAIGWLVGWALRERTERTEAAEGRAVRAEREREAAARIAVAEERGRIARELHDVVAHAVSVIVLQVGAVRHRLPEDAEAEREALRNVEEAGRTALAEMRRLLTAMREEGDEAELLPRPGLGDLARLVHDVDAAGLRVDVHVRGEPVPLPPGLDLSAYRIVQEGLTNSLRHSGAGRAEVTVDYAPDELLLEVRDHGAGDPGASGGHGHGLVGIRERVKLFGGEMSAGPAPGGGFLVRARLPREVERP